MAITPRRDPRPRVLLRAASGPKVGMGHVMRSFAVAQEIVRCGGEALLIVDDERSAEALDARVRGIGRFDVVWEGDASDWIRLPAQSAWLDGFRDWSSVIDDLKLTETPTMLVENRTPARDHATRILYPALHHRHDAWDLAHPDQILSGARWIPLRRAVIDEPEALARNIDLLVSFGGSDPNQLTERVLRVLQGDKRTITVAIGPLMAARRRRIEELVTGIPNGSVLETGAELAPWMARSKSAVTALGTTLYELAFHRVPALILANQESDQDALDWYGKNTSHQPVGVAGDVDDELLRKQLLRASRLKSGAPLPELGAGATRLAEHLLGGL